MESYIICSTPRTGSTLLCDLLASTKFAGNPDSFFMRDVDPVWAKQWGAPDRVNRSDADACAAYLAAAIRAGKGETSIFGLRLMRKDLGDLSAMVDRIFPGLPTDGDRLQAAFGEALYIHLAREDKLAQAVSMVKAEQTGLWHIAPDGTEVERLSPPKQPQYDFDRIARKVAELEQSDPAWLAWFEAQAIEPLRIGYECLSANPAESVLLVCKRLGVVMPEPDRLKPGVAKLADATSVEWMRRYQSEVASSAS